MLRSRSLFVPLFLSLSLAVACNKPTDNGITTNIKAKMYSDPLLKSASVNVTSKDGIVTLTGVVPDDAARLAAEQIASKTEGVKQVIDSTTMAPPAPMAAEVMPAPAPAPPPQPEPKPARSKSTPAKRSRTPENATSPPPTPATSAAATEPAPVSPAGASAVPATPPPPQPITVTIPEGAVLTVRTIDTIDSATSTVGQSFGGSLDNPVVVDDRVVLPRGLNVKLKLIQASTAGKFEGRSELTVSLDSVTYQGRTYTLSSSDVQQKGASRGKRSAAVIGGGAVLGAIIGGLAGGGKGAAIGAAAGGGGGTAVQAMTKGQQVKIPSETRLDFTLHSPVNVTYLPAKRSARTASSTDSTDQTQPLDQPPQQ
jgi:hypothetical protein